MKRFALYAFITLSACISQAQLVLKPIDHPEQKYSTSSSRKVQQVLSLPFWEDFSQSQTQPDTNRWVSGQDVYINNTLGQGAPTYNVATFDGLKGDGRAHNISNNFSGPGDSLISQPIDLSGIADKASVYLSFYWQAGGNGEIPDEKDSLRLMFLTDSNTWVTRWRVGGGMEVSKPVFSQAIIRVEEAYQHSQFQFKFESASSQKGPFDTWNVDYIYLNDSRTASDTFYLDRSLSGSPTMLFDPYFEIPAHLFFSQQDEVMSAQQILATNLSREPHPIQYSYLIKNVGTGEAYFEFESDNVAGFTGYDVAGRSISSPDNMTLSINDGSALDSVVISSTFIYNTKDSFLDSLANINDTIQTRYTLHDYYAYDDGTAEFAAAMNIQQGQVAVRFALAAPDTITHIDIHFPNIAPESSGKRLALQVWDRLGDEPRSLQEIVIPTTKGLNQFERFKLTKPVLTKDTVYIGYRQFTDNYIGIGFDRNNTGAGSEIFTNISENEWEQNVRLEGALMIRPVFRKDTATFTLNTKLPNPTLELFPNPSRGFINIKGQHDQITIYDLSGQQVFEASAQERHDVSFLKNGLYLVKISSQGRITTRKVLIAK